MTTPNKNRERAIYVLRVILVVTMVALGHVSGVAKGERQARAECVELQQ